jgi:hypothetical protein
MRKNCVKKMRKPGRTLGKEILILRVVLEPFAVASLETRFGSDVSVGTQAALRHYVRRLRSQRKPVAIPSFRRGPEAGTLAGPELELSVPPDVEAALTREARRQGVSLERIVAHAVFVYVADLEAPAPGRVADSGDQDPAEEGPVPARSSSRAHPRFRDPLSALRRTRHAPS